MRYSIGEAAKITGLSVSALRYYDKEGLFPAMGRNGGGIRAFTDREIVATRIIERLKFTGRRRIESVPRRNSGGDAKRLRALLRRRQIAVHCL